MATVNILKSSKKQTRAGLAATIKYCMREDKIKFGSEKLVTGINCVAESSYSEMMNTKNNFSKTDGRMFYHFVQSFSPAEKISAEKVHEIAVRFANEQFKGYEVLVATHTDSNHLHSHFVVNSVSFENGKKYHSPNNNIELLRNKSDMICSEYGLSVVENKSQKHNSISPMTPGEYQSASRCESWKMELIVNIEDSMKVATNKETFCMMMKLKGYEVSWTDNRKNITFTTPTGKKCRDNKLHETKFLKENMENEFRIRNEIDRRIEKTDEEFNDTGSNSDSLCDGNRKKLGCTFADTKNANRSNGGNNEHDVNFGKQREYCGLYESAIKNFEGGIYKHKTVGERFGTCNDSGCVENGYEYQRSHETIEYTGWESERKLFLCNLARARQDEKIYQKNVSDIAHPLMYALGIGISSAVVLGGIAAIADENCNVKKHDDLADFMAIIAVTAIGIALISQYKKSGENTEKQNLYESVHISDFKEESNYEGPTMDSM